MRKILLLMFLLLSTQVFAVFGQFYEKWKESNGSIKPNRANIVETPQIKVTDEADVSGKADVYDSFSAVWVDTAGTVWGGTMSGLKKSTDKGLTFTLVDVAVSAVDRSTVFQAANGYLYWNQWGTGKIRRSTDGGNTWADVHSFDGTDSGLWGICEDSLGYLYAGIYTMESVVADVVLRSTDNGANWTSVYDGSDQHVHDIACDPGTDYIYATVDGGGIGTSRIIRSVDHGENWTSIDTGTTYVAIGFLSGMRLFAKEANGEIYKTTDDASFTKVYTAGSNLAGFDAVKDDNGRLYFGQVALAAGQHPQIISTVDGTNWNIAWKAQSTGAWHGVNWMSNVSPAGDIYVSVGGSIDHNFRFSQSNPVYTNEIKANINPLVFGGSESTDEKLTYDFRTEENKVIVGSISNVSEIEFQNMKILADGIVTNAPSNCRVYRGTSDQTITKNTWVKIEFNAESYDAKDEFDSTTNYRFTATDPGIYLSTGALRVKLLTADTNVYIVAKVNGTEVNRYNTAPCKSSWFSFPFVFTLKLAASDYVEIYFYHEDSADRALHADGQYTWCSIEKIQ